MDQEFIVVEDLSGRLMEGTVLSSIDGARAKAEGVALLPIRSDRFLVSGIHGFASRRWGTGWPLGTSSRFVAPLTLLLPEGSHRLHWMARIRLLPDAFLSTVAGTLSFTPVNTVGSGTAGYASMSPPIQAGALRDEIRPDERGWVVRGEGNLSVPQITHISFALYGALPGMTVEWVAASIDR